MAANNFATMLHRNTNKFTVVLVYAVLEWALILLLLLNSLFSYLLLRFADYFGLPRPCPWCSRLDHLFDSRHPHLLRDLVCPRHAAEISRLRFCSSHRRLAELSDLCHNCLSYSSSLSPDKYDGRSAAPCGNGEPNSMICSCCGLTLERKLLCCHTQEDDQLSYIQEKDFDADRSRSDLLLGDFLGDEEFGEFKAAEPCVRKEAITVVDEKVVLVVEKKQRHDYTVYEVAKDYSSSDQNPAILLRDAPVMELKEEEGENFNVFEFEKDSSSSSSFDVLLPIVSSKEEPADTSSGRHLEFFIGGYDCQLIPVEWTDSISGKSSPRLSPIMEEDQEDCGGYDDVIMDFCPPSERKTDSGAENNFSLENESEALDSVEQVESEVLENISDEVRGISMEAEVVQLLAADLIGDNTEECLFPEGGSPGDVQAAEEKCTSRSEEVDAEVSINAASEEECASQNDEVDAEVSIGTEIPEQEPIDVDEIHDEETLSWDPCREGDEAPSTSCDFPHNADSNNHDEDDSRSEEDTLEFRTISVEMPPNVPNHQLNAELHETDDERIPDTPSSIDSLHQLHRRILLLEKRDSGSMEESLDGSVMGDIEGDESMLTVEELKSALRVERKTLHALYTELEEERNASAVAASQTMAMINRLQEEKAAMQMEALQYHRMMEEQSEYDQEALQLLNDLIVKREKEKQELEMELEVYRRKVEEYEAKENRAANMAVPTNSRDSSSSCSNEEESDGLSIDLNEDSKGEDAINGHRNTPSEAVLYFENSLTSFEEEKVSILKQLKSLEGRMFTLNDEEEEEHWNCKEYENGHVETNNSSENGHSAMNGNTHNYRHARFAGPKAKSLLPLFDAIGQEMDEEWSQKTPVDHAVADDRKIAIIEGEVDHIYERLQVLEADREFLKHCVGSLRKGDKGLELLGEILQHLRDLRCAEFHGRDIVIGGGIMQY